jgi:hypothetical protein
MLKGAGFKVFQVLCSAESLFRKAGSLCDFPHRNCRRTGAEWPLYPRGNVMQVTLPC